MSGDTGAGLVVVFDDLRVPLFDFDVIARSSAAALDFLEAAWTSDDDVVIRQLWLDHDLGGSDTIKPVLSFLESLGAAQMGKLGIRGASTHAEPNCGPADSARASDIRLPGAPGRPREVLQEVVVYKRRAL